jgi:hypothetical protein
MTLIRPRIISWMVKCKYKNSLRVFINKNKILEFNYNCLVELIIINSNLG